MNREDCNRLIEVLFSDLDRHTSSLEVLTDPQAAIARYRQEASKYPGGMAAHQAEHARRNALLQSIQMSVNAGWLAQPYFERLLKILGTKEGRTEYLEWLTQLQEHQATLEQKQASASRRDHMPLFKCTQEQILAILQQKPSGPGPLVDEFMQRGDVQARGIYLKHAAIYEFDWGFITQQSDIYDFYVAQVWRQGTTKYIDRFLSGWKEEVEHDLESLRIMSWGELRISFDDGRSNFSCLSLGNFSSGEKGRRWIGLEFMVKVFPVLAAKVLDPEYKFAKNWHCY